MDNSSEMMSLCRLCLVKDQVNVPIFEEQGDVRQIFFKISSCLPVKVSRDDKLPKKICDGCLYKLDMLYEFWKTSANAEKTLLSWLGQAGVKGTDVHQTLSAVAQEITNKPNDSGGGAFVKEEPNDAAAHQTQEVDPNFMLQNFQQKWGEDNAAAGSSASAAAASSATVEEPPRKRARRTAAVKAQINLTPETDEDDDDDMDNVEPITKVEDESDESDGDDRDDGQFGDVSGTNNDDQPGPSGVGKDGGEIPLSSIQIKSEYEVFECRLCVKQFSQYEDHVNHHIESHKLIAHDITELCTENCVLSFDAIADAPDTSEIKQETESSTGYSCKACGKTYDRKQSLLNHVKTKHEPTMKHECEVCHKRFNYMYELKRHNATHMEKTLTCDQCDKRFSCQRYLDFHVQCYHAKESKLANQNGYLCPICGKKLNRAESLQYHMLVIHKAAEATLFCEECGKGFHRSRDLRVHVRAHLKVRQVDCDICGKSLSDLSSLMRHMCMIHNISEGNHECEYCGQKFYGKRELQYHVDTVHLQRDWTCDLCTKTFKSQMGLQRHVKMHDPEQQFRKCNICDKDILVSSLSAHKRNYHSAPKTAAENKKTKTRPTKSDYTCKVCGKANMTQSTWYRHMNRHSSTLAYECDICSKRFRLLGSLAKHKRECQKSQAST